MRARASARAPVSCVLSSVFMPKARLELARAGARQILSLLRLPIPPLGRVSSEHNKQRQLPKVTDFQTAQTQKAHLAVRP